MLLNEALGLWRGPALPELADMPFAQAETLRLEELRLLKRRIDADLESSRRSRSELKSSSPSIRWTRGSAAADARAVPLGRQADALRSTGTPAGR